MNIPRFWAEARATHREKRRQVTVRRFGWSLLNQTEAEAMAEARLEDALRAVLAGEDRVRFEPRAAYNGADGFPIREEIVQECGDTVVTRNSYGALCLNTPDVLFGDIDFPASPGNRHGCLVVLLLVVVLPAAVSFGPEPLWALFAFLTGLALSIGWLANGYRGWIRLQGGAGEITRRRIRRFLESHPDWRLRLYRTPAGYRVVAMHRLFDPGDPEVADFFDALRCDPVYVRMCRNQRCFRARVSPKPWRIGIGHLRPRTGVWPIRPESMPFRRAWVDAYDAQAADFASCRSEEEMGQGPVHGKVLEVLGLHDRLSRSDSGLPIA